MPLSGKRTAEQLLSSTLDAASLVRLARDFLFVRGHEQLRITDGPGDGGRDVHSVSPRRFRHLTQCKFHADPSIACSSAELGELPMAMTKFGYPEGTFITNARISPQAKREYLDNYPQLQLEFLDGDVLATEVFSNPLLNALWFDGTHICRVNATTAFPVLVRDHAQDAPIDLCGQEAESRRPNWATAASYLTARYERRRFRLRRAMPTTEPFEPYRAPEPLAGKEGGLPFIFAAEVFVDGDVALTDLATLADDIARALLIWVGEDSPGVSVRVGKPYVVTLGGEDTGVHVATSLEPISYVQTPDSCGEESEWYGIGSSTDWDMESDARVSEAGSIRLYSKQLDCCLSYEITSRVCWRDRVSRIAMREVLEGGWMKSVFALVPQRDEWCEAGIPEPDESAIWPWDGRTLCGWLHWTILGGPVPLRAPGEDLGFPSEADEATRLGQIKEYLTAMPGVEVVEPRKARYMVALLGDDPLPDSESIVYLTPEVVTSLKTLPSPIRPTARRFSLTVAWSSDLAAEAILDAFNEGAAQVAPGLIQSAEVEWYEGVVAITAVLSPFGLEIFSTEVILHAVHQDVERLLAVTEHALRPSGKLARATADYWKRRTGVRLGCSWRDSSKAYVWGIDDGGRAWPLNAQELLGEPKSA